MAVTLTRTQLLVLAIGVVAVLGILGTRLSRAGGAAATQPAAAPLTPVAAASARAPLYVDVVGAVRRPGLYRLRDGARVADAVQRAGGPTRRAEVALVNLAAPLVDGMQVVVPARGAVADGASAGAQGGRVSLSSATAADLVELPGIGPVTAAKIVDWRAAHGPFRSVEALDEVPGIGPARIEQLRDLVSP